MKRADPLEDPITVDVHRFAATFVRRLRSRGVNVAADAGANFLAALAEIDMTNRTDLYWAGRATLVTGPDDIGTYDGLFAHVIDRAEETSLVTLPPPDPHPLEATIGVDDPGLYAAAATHGTRTGRPSTQLRWSDAELLRTRDFAQCSHGELAEVNRLVAEMRLTPAARPSRRHRPARGHHGSLDVRETTRASMRTGGEPLTTRYRARRTRQRRLVLLCDISGSMEIYSRTLVRFAHAAVSGFRDVEVFTLGTRCTRITRTLRTHDPDRALDDAAAAVADWSGGTRLGDGFREFNDNWGQRGLARGATVVVVSDGWDRGDPADLGEQVARLRRIAHRLIWVNPLKASPGFAPTAGGMAAALGHIDVFLEGHSLDALDALAEVITR